MILISFIKVLTHNIEDDEIDGVRLYLILRE
jgi:hypothetical protein